MAGRKKSRGRKSSRRKTAKQSYAGLTKKQLIARLRAASAGRKTKKGRRKKKGGAFTRIPSGYLAGVSAANRRHAERAARAAGTYEESEASKWNDLGRRRKKGKKGSKKGRKRPLSAWQKYIKANKNRRGMRKKNGMLNLRALAAGYRKSPAGRKSKAKRGGKKRGSKKRSSRRDYGWY